MRGAPILFALAALALAPRPAAAALMQWDGTLTLLSSLAAEEITAEVSGVAVVLDAGNGYTLKTLRLLGTQAGSGVFLVTDPETIGEGVAAVRLEASVGFGTLSPFDPLASLSSPQLVAGQLPLRGVVKVCLLSSACTSFVPIPLHAAEAPSAVGVGGIVTFGGGGTLRISVEAAPWTIRDAALLVSTSSGQSFELFTEGWVHGPFSFTGSTAVTGAELSLVTPMVVRTHELPGASTAFARLGVRFVPEPGGLFLLGSGAAGLAALRRHRRAAARDPRPVPPSQGDA